MRAITLLITSFLFMVSLAECVSAEETFSITVDPAKWNRAGYGEYQSNITGDGWPVDFPIGENFTFTLKVANLENGTEYLFSFEIRYSTSWYQMERDQYPEWEDRAVVTNVSHNFIGNNTEEYVYNLTGQLTSEYDHVPLNSCTMLEARVNFVKNPNAKNDTLRELANFTSQEDFLPNGNMHYGGFYMSNCYNPEPITLGERVAVLALVIALPLLFLFSIYKINLIMHGRDVRKWAILFWLTMLFLPILIFSYFSTQMF